MNIDGFKYWEYVLIHTYIMMVISHEASTIMEGLVKVYNMNKKPDTENNYHDPRR